MLPCDETRSAGWPRATAPAQGRARARAARIVHDTSGIAFDRVRVVSSSDTPRSRRRSAKRFSGSGSRSWRARHHDAVLAELEQLCNVLYNSHNPNERAHAEGVLRPFSTNVEYITQCKVRRGRGRRPFPRPRTAASAQIQQLRAHPSESSSRSLPTGYPRQRHESLRAALRDVVAHEAPDGQPVSARAATGVDIAQLRHQLPRQQGVEPGGQVSHQRQSSCCRASSRPAGWMTPDARTRRSWRTSCTS